MVDFARRRVVRCYPTFLNRLLRGRRDAVISSDWPEDAVIVHADSDPTRPGLRLFVISDSFDEVPEGALAPEWSPTFTAHSFTTSELGRFMELVDEAKREMQADDKT